MREDPSPAKVASAQRPRILTQEEPGEGTKNIFCRTPTFKFISSVLWYTKRVGKKAEKKD